VITRRSRVITFLLLGCRIDRSPVTQDISY
jgi:hypothetical protein